MDRSNIVAVLKEIVPEREFDNLSDDTNLIDMGFLDSGKFLDLIGILEERSGREIDFMDVDAALLTSIDGLLLAFGSKVLNQIGSTKQLEQGPDVLSIQNLNEAVATIIISFCSDPLIGWILPNLKKRLDFLQDFASFFIQTAVPDCGVHVLPDFSGVAIWTSADESMPSSRLQSIFAEHISLSILRQYFSMSAELDLAKPAGQHLTLQLIGVDPVRQGQGIATSLIDFGLREADRQGLPTYLQSTNPRNIPLYQRFGFKIVKEVGAAGVPPRIAMVRARQ